MCLNEPNNEREYKKINQLLTERRGIKTSLYIYIYVKSNRV